MMYNDDFFTNPECLFSITDSDLEMVRSLNSEVNESYYYDTMLTWNLGSLPKEADPSRIYVVMQFLSMVGEVNKDLYEKHNLKPYHISLLRRLYLGFEEVEQVFIAAKMGGVRGSASAVQISMDHKRPFGNSNVLEDVRREMYNHSQMIATNTWDIPDPDEMDDNYSVEEEVLLQFTNFLSDFFKGGFEIKWRNFTPYQGFGFKNTTALLPQPNKNFDWHLILKEFDQYPLIHSNLRYWEIDPSELRDKKIEHLLK